MASQAAALALLMFLNYGGHLNNNHQHRTVDQRYACLHESATAGAGSKDVGLQLQQLMQRNALRSMHLPVPLQVDVAASRIDSSRKEVECVSGAYPPDPSWMVPKRVVNLDLPPHERWRDITLEFSGQMQELLSAIHNLTHPIFHGLLFKIVDNYGAKLVETLPYPFADEMKGIADASGLPLGEVALFNVFYEVFTVCTSILGQTPSGQLFHGRNLDFGLLLGWDHQNHTWLTTEILRRMTVEVDFQSSGQTVFKGTTFAGYVGVLTGMKPGLFSLTVDERFKLVGGYVGIIEWIMGQRSRTWMSFLTRSVLENASSYEEAQTILASTPLLAPVYFILGGNQAGQASVITRGLKFVDIWNISQEKWYLVQTNYDHWKKPPWYDDRRTPAKTCLDRLGQENFTLAELFNVLSTKPINNKLTAHTTLMEVSSGDMQSYLQYCTDPDCTVF